MTLHIGNNLVKINHNNTYASLVKIPFVPSIPTMLGSRLDNKATVVGVLQDHEGNDYVLAVVDAAYRSGSPILRSPKGASSLPWHRLEKDALADRHTGKYYTDVIIAETSINQNDAIYFATNACSIFLKNMEYKSVLPSLYELTCIYDNRIELDKHDPTLNDYPERSLTNFTFGSTGSRSSTARQSTGQYMWIKNSDGTNNILEYRQSSGVCPVFCIPLS